MTKETTAPLAPFSQNILREFDAAPHWTHTYLFGFLLNGRVALTTQGTQHILRTNDICFLPPYELYALTSMETGSYMLMMEINVDFIDSFCKNTTSLGFSECQIPYNIDNPIYYALCKETAQIIFHSINIQDNSSLYMMSAIAKIMGLLMDNYGCIRESENTLSEYSRQRIVQTLTYINDHFSQKISLKEIAAHIGIHPQYFSSFFKKEFKINFIDYLNNYRIAKSISPLLDSDLSITEIAQTCGFSDHKTYGISFKRMHGCSPSQFRKLYAEDYQNRFIPPDAKTQFDFDPKQYFRFFQRFWTPAAPDSIIFDKKQQYITLQTNLETHQKPIKVNRQMKINNAGRAFSCLQNHVQDQIRMAKRELQFDYLRIRDIFSDDLYIYFEDGDHNIRYNWSYIDRVLDFFMSIQAKPMMEIGFMPSALASKNQTSGWQYHPNVSFPKSLNRWSALVTAFIEHCVLRYGINEVRTWYFDFWTAPNLQLKDAYWHESQEDFLRFYKATWQAIKGVDDHIKFGTPTFSMPAGLDWYDAFFEYCVQNKLQPDYISVHTYCSTDQLANYGGQFPQTHHRSEVFSITYDKDFPEKTFDFLKNLAQKWDFGTLPIIATSWNLTFMPSDYTRDTCFMAPYIIYTLLHSLGKADGLCYWTLFGTDDELYPDNRMFSGTPGLIDLMELKKPSYYAIWMYRLLDKNIIEYDDCHILAQSTEGFQLLIFNFTFYDEAYLNKALTAPSYTERNKYFNTAGEIVYHHSIKLPSGNYMIRRTELSETHGSTYDTWMRIGSPQNPAPDLVNYIQQTSLPQPTFSSITVFQNLVLDTIVPEHGVVLYEVTRQVRHE